MSITQVIYEQLKDLDSMINKWQKQLEITQERLKEFVSSLAVANVEILRLRNDNEELEAERDAFRTTLANLDGKVREMMISIDSMRRP